MGPADQPDYVNAVMAVDTTLEPLALLDQLQGIEAAHGRVRLGERWGPRTLDLDILAFGDQEIRTTRLQVPHPGMAEREFVLYPLMEIAPDLALPAVGLLKNLVGACPRRGLRVMADE
jgi:2-amino-4-hydroxy-6-hydroxymethyldihydropteridine diphosphokinase